MELENLAEFDPSIPKHKPYLTKPIAILIIIMFIIEIIFHAMYDDKAIIMLGAKWNEGIRNGEYWRFITCVFLHGNLFHLLLNTGAMFIFGKEIESTFGSIRFLLIFLLAAWGSGLASYFYSNGLAIGASGVIFGLLGSLITYFYRQRERIAGATIRFKSMYTLAIINIILGFIIPRIDNSAHIGGLITGLISSWFISPEYKIEKNEMSNKIYIVQKKDKLRVIFGIFIMITLLSLITRLNNTTF